MEEHMHARNAMVRLSQAALVLSLLTSPLLAADLVNVAGASKIAVGGYDPVAFFTDGKPVPGSPSISATYQGAIYFFSSEEHKGLFTKDMEKYAPQYGGFCAYGVGHNALAPVDISTWQVRDGKLYLNVNSDVLKLFNADFKGNVSRADENWPGLVKKNGR
jgi:YHS domain-containing protein